LIKPIDRLTNSSAQKKIIFLDKKDLQVKENKEHRKKVKDGFGLNARNTRIKSHQ